MEGTRTFEDVIFGAILGVWSLRVEALWTSDAPSYRPLSFLLAAAALALALRLLWAVRATGRRLAWYGWLVILIALVSFLGVVGGIFAVREGVVFGLVFLSWSLTAIAGDWLSRLVGQGG